MKGNHFRCENLSLSFFIASHFIRDHNDHSINLKQCFDKSEESFVIKMQFFVLMISSSFLIDISCGRQRNSFQYYLDCSEGRPTFLLMKGIVKRETFSCYLKVMCEMRFHFLSLLSCAKFLNAFLINDIAFSINF